MDENEKLKKLIKNNPKEKVTKMHKNAKTSS
jgi:hypothetical protein